MSLFEKIKSDRIIAMNQKQTLKKDLLGTLISDCCKETKIPDDIKIISTIKKYIENNNDILAYNLSIVTASKLCDEIDILTEYLPQQLTELEIRLIVEFQLINTTNLGSIMKHFKENYTGRYDGKIVSIIAKELIDAK